MKAVSTNEHGEVCENIIKTIGAAAGIKLYPTDEEIRADGIDMTHLVLKIVVSDW